MRRLAALLFLICATTTAWAQGVPNYPQTLCANCVVGRLGIGSGPTQPITFAVLASKIFTSGGTFVIVPTNGGTGLSTYVLGDTLYASAANTLAALSGNTTSTKKFLSQTGNGSVSAAPAWGQPAAADLSNGVTGSGSIVLASGPTLTTPTLGAATATTINKITLTQPATGATLTLADNKTLTVNNILTLSGTDSTTMTFPSTNGTVAALNIADQTVSGGANITSQSLSTGNVTIDCGSRPNQFITNGGAFTITAPANDGSCLLLITNNATAGAVTFSGFTVSANTGDSLTTTNTNKFTVSIWRINGTAGYRIVAHQ